VLGSGTLMEPESHRMSEKPSLSISCIREEDDKLIVACSRT
jgi:hypothetical protein